MTRVMKNLILMAILMCLVSCGRDLSYMETPPEKLIVPATETSDEPLVSFIEKLNETLEELYPGHPNLPIIIERSRYPNDGGAELIALNVPEQLLGLRLNSILTVHAHWMKSHNGFLIYKTWHLGVMDETNFGKGSSNSGTMDGGDGGGRGN